MSGTAVERLRDRKITFANGAVGRPIEIQTANPLNYHQAITAPTAMPAAVIDGQLFLPPGATGKLPLVMVVPGSLTVGPNHLGHAEMLSGLGLATFVLDPFSGRGVTSTVANQTQFSFAASAYDVLASVKALAALPEIDARRIGAQGHSRGGAAVLTAAARRFAGPILGDTPPLAAVLAAYPWCGHQFLDPDIGATVVRVLMGDRDEWCSAQQAQGHVQAMRLRGGKATMRLFAGAAHSFDRGVPVWRIAEAAVSPGAPTGYLADDGAFIHPVDGKADPKLVDRDLMVYALKAGYGIKGASLGSDGDQPALFQREMAAFWQNSLPG
jgi:dienelactone hydrolase